MLVFLNILCVIFLLIPALMISLHYFLKPGNGGEENNLRGKYDFGIIIPAYGNVRICLEVLTQLSDLKDESFHVYLVADNADDIDVLPEYSWLTVIVPESLLHLKLKSMIRAYEVSGGNHSHYVIFDSDNTYDQAFFSEIKKYLDSGFRIVQGRRVAKNTDADISRLDAIAECYKNYIERIVAFELGSFPTLSGSGVCIEKRCFVEYLELDFIRKNLENRNMLTAEDKVMHNYAIDNNIDIAFAKKAIVYDAKIDRPDKLVNQRSRWLLNYFNNLPKSLSIFAKGIIAFDRKGIILGFNSLNPPIVVLAVLSLVCLILDLIFLPLWVPVLLFSAVVFFAGIYASLKLSNVSAQVLNSFYKLPLFGIYQFLGLLSLLKPKRKFEVTQNWNTEEE